MTRNTPIGFLEGVGVALLAAVAAGAGYVLLRLVLDPAQALSLLITAVGLGYLLYLLARTEDRTGRISAVILWATLSTATLALAPGLALPVQLGLLWLVRSLYHQQGLIGAGLDLALWLLGLGGALWAIRAGGSVALAVWTLLLIQALFPLIRSWPHPSPRGASGEVPATGPDRFERALHEAETCLRRLNA
jgi:hypothetical protein